MSVNLESTLNKTLNQNSQTKKKVEFDLEDEFPSFTEERTRPPAQYLSGREASRGVRNVITPKKINFDDAQPKRQGKENPTSGGHPKNKSFLSMISPIKMERCASALEERHEQR